MTEDILDDYLHLTSMDQISDRVLCEIKLSQKKYPKKVVDLVNEEIDKRSIIISDFNPDESSTGGVKTNVFTWMKGNPVISIFTLLVAAISLFIGNIFTGLIALTLVFISVYASTQVNPRVRKKIWRMVNLMVTLLITGIIVLSLVVN